MPELYFEDFPVGAAFGPATLTVEAEDAAFFAGQFAPEAQEDGAAGTILPGFHVAALGMRLLFEAVVCRTASMGAPGVDEVTWPHPVRVGDTLRFVARVTAARLSASRPEMGLVSVAFSLFNQHDVVVMTQSFAFMARRRTPGRETLA